MPAHSRDHFRGPGDCWSATDYRRNIHDSATVYISVVHTCVSIRCIFHENLYTAATVAAAVAVWFPLIKQLIQCHRREREIYIYIYLFANVLATVRIFLVPPHFAYVKSRYPRTHRYSRETQFLSRASPFGRGLAEKTRAHTIRRSKFRWSRFNPPFLSLFLPLSLGVLLSHEQHAEGADVPARSVNPKGKRPKKREKTRGGSNFAPAPLLSLFFPFLLFLSPFCLLDAGETRFIYVTIRHSILLYSSAYVLSVLTARRARSESPPRWLRNPRVSS